MNIISQETFLLKGPHPLKNLYKSQLKLSTFQRNILIGTLLGDASIEARGKNPSFRYYFSHQEAQLDYVNHIFSHFSDWCSCLAVSGDDSSTRFYYFRTCTHPSFAFYFHQFYSLDQRVKVVPPLIYKFLNPQVLAYWFMDNGCKSNLGYILNTQNFSFEQQELLASCLGRKFHLHVTIHKDRNRYRLYITCQSSHRFTEIIRPFILPSFHSKLISP